MDKLNHDRSLVQKVLTHYAEFGQRSFPIKPKFELTASTETALIFDENHDHYLLVIIGWQGEERIKSTTIYTRLKDDKIWIEEDWTEAGVATDFLQAGVPSQNIILAFHPPHLRQYTEFATA